MKNKKFDFVVPFTGNHEADMIQVKKELIFLENHIYFEIIQKFNSDEINLHKELIIKTMNFYENIEDFQKCKILQKKLMTKNLEIKKL